MERVAYDGNRVARLMALAIRLDGLIREGAVAGQAELARLGHVSRARLTQIMNLLCLAPDIQEALLFLPATERGRDAVMERQLRPIAAVPSWNKQRQMRRELTQVPDMDLSRSLHHRATSRLQRHTAAKAVRPPIFTSSVHLGAIPAHSPRFQRTRTVPGSPSLRGAFSSGGPRP